MTTTQRKTTGKPKPRATRSPKPAPRPWFLHTRAMLRDRGSRLLLMYSSAVIGGAAACCAALAADTLPGLLLGGLLAWPICSASSAVGFLLPTALDDIAQRLCPSMVKIGGFVADAVGGLLFFGCWLGGILGGIAASAVLIHALFGVFPA